MTTTRGAGLGAPAEIGDLVAYLVRLRRWSRQLWEAAGLESPLRDGDSDTGGEPLPADGSLSASSLHDRIAKAWVALLSRSGDVPGPAFPPPPPRYPALIQSIARRLEDELDRLDPDQDAPRRVRLMRAIGRLREVPAGPGRARPAMHRRRLPLVLVAGDPRLRVPLRRQLERQASCLESGGLREALMQVRMHRPDVAFLVGGRLEDRIAAARSLKRAHPPMQVVVLTEGKEVPPLPAPRAGAYAYLPRDSSPELVRDVLMQASLLSAGLGARVSAGIAGRVGTEVPSGVGPGGVEDPIDRLLLTEILDAVYRWCRSREGREDRPPLESPAVPSH